MTQTTAPCRPARDAAALRQQAEAAAGPQLSRAQLTPVLPAKWPDAGGGAVFFAYRSEPMPTGRVLYRVSGPLLSVSYGELAAAPVLALLEGPVLGEEEKRRDSWPADFKAQLERAQQALLEVVAGCRTAESARAELQPYATWLQQSDLIARDLAPRVKPFFTWLSP